MFVAFNCHIKHFARSATLCLTTCEYFEHVYNRMECGTKKPIAGAYLQFVRSCIFVPHARNTRMRLIMVQHSMLKENNSFYYLTIEKIIIFAQS